MGKKSTKENKTVYHQSRENAGYTRESASDAIGPVLSADRIERIENERLRPHPEDVLAMAKCYGDYSLCNYFCTHECQIGHEYMPEVKAKDLSQITIEMLSILNTVNKEKDRLVDIVVDGEISKDELPDFLKIQKDLEKMTLAISSLKIWVDNTIASGKIDTKSL